MASIFKRTNRKNEVYLIQYLDHEGNRKTEKGFTDKGLTEQLAAKLEGEARLRSTGMIDTQQERLAEIKQSPIDEHVDAFATSISERSGDYVRHTMSRLKKIVAGAGITSLEGITSSTVTEYLRKLRKQKKLGPRTYNHYLQAIDAFCNFCVPERLAANPLVRTERLNVEVDIRHQRRALKEEEFGKLIQSARDSGISIQRFSGEQRARIYTISYFTGLRQKELASLTLRSFDLKSDPPTVTVEAASSKHRKKDVLPLHPELVTMLKAWLQGLKPLQKLFPGLERKKAWLMVKRDLERVGIPYKTEDGIADFHAAGRHTHITGLFRGGVAAHEVQKLARHACITTTMKYVHVDLADKARAIRNLSASALQMRCISGGVECHSVSSDGKTLTKRKRPTPCRSKGLGVDCHRLSIGGNLEAGGIEPPLDSDATNNQPCGCEFCTDPCAANALHSCGSNCQFMATIDADLQSVIAAWERLPEAIRRAITGLVHSQQGSER